jgi:hypothetical protein
MSQVFRHSRGVCAVCGHNVALKRTGTPVRHSARRVRKGRDGQPEIFMAEDCVGSFEPAESLAAQLAPTFVAPAGGAR